MENLDKNRLVAYGSLALLIAILIFSLFGPIIGGVLFLIIVSITAFLRQKKLQKRESVHVERNQQSLYIPESVNVITSTTTFKEVAGLQEAKNELFEIIDFLKNPDKYRKFLAHVPKGVILSGPPGVGKTMLAKAVAGEAGVPFFYQSGSSFVEIYVGMGAKRVKALFNEAKKNAPAIIFIDEIDAVGKDRAQSRSDEREATLNQLLTEMDGFEDSSGIVVIAATNRVNSLDEALLRPGRFDRKVILELPSLEDRVAILDSYLVRRPSNVDIEVLARMTSGFSGAALENLVNEAALIAVKEDLEKITLETFLSVKEKVLFGTKPKRVLSQDEKEHIALYQTSKAYCAKSLGLDFEKVSFFNYEFLTPITHIADQKTYFDTIVAQVAGVVAYDLFYKMRYANISDDIRIVRKWIEQYQNEFDLENREEYHTLILKVMQSAEALLESKKEKIIALQKKLLEDEVLTKDDI
jgi:cell division protease FtsH